MRKTTYHGDWRKFTLDTSLGWPLKLEFQYCAQLVRINKNLEYGIKKQRRTSCSDLSCYQSLIRPFSTREIFRRVVRIQGKVRKPEKIRCERVITHRGKLENGRFRRAVTCELCDDIHPVIGSDSNFKIELNIHWILIVLFHAMNSSISDRYVSYVLFSNHESNAMLTQ